MQIVEIVKAINLNADLLILDEPTSSLTIKETEILFTNLRKFRDRGVTIIFISHRLEEVFEIIDRISVLRDGRYLGTFEASRITPKEVVTLIAGKELLKELEHRQSSEECACPEVVLAAKNLSRGKYFRNIDFELFQGEILGFYGLQGSGRTEIMETIFGMYKPESGEIYIKGKPVTIESPGDAIHKGLALIPEDRRRAGIFQNMDVKDNIAIIHKRGISKFSFMQKSKVFAIAAEYARKLSIKITGISQMVRQLSGGNQQKVIISRCLSTKPSILLMDEPTRGIDVGTKAEIFKILRKLKTEENLSIIIVSSELQEVVAECDRVIVMFNGQISGTLTGTDITKEKVLQYAFSGSANQI
ncbi:MAG: sugar ABC transporter ATP-binding protein [Spirochaetales bacterium]|nr:MAG: sugar ABC transporter ATP-binding protein [Spirochaetales bacterium]